MRGLQGRVAIVTGATKDMGMAIAERLGAEGAKVMGCGRDADSGEQCAAAIRAKGGDAQFMRVDVGIEEDVKRVIRAAVSHFGRLDIVVNVAALVGGHRNGTARRITEETNEAFLDHMRINVMAPFWFFKHAIPKMQKNGGGSFVNISSLAGRKPMPALPSYSTSKAALEGLSRQVALDYGECGIRSNCVVVGAIRNSRNARLHEHPQAGPALRQTQILQRSGLAEDVASMVAFLASEESSFITGEALPVDGGALVKHQMPDLRKAFHES